KFPQSIAHLHNDYGQYQEPELMVHDVFYALDELFQLSAASIDQVLELLEDRIRRLMLGQSPTELPELLLAKAYVDDLRRSVRDTLDIVRHRGSSHWPRTKDSRLARKAERAANDLESKYVSLHRRCEECSDQCSNGITILANAGAREQTQKAIEQTDKVTKLTFLAYVFVPMSFSASFFGMN
ncbi:uncharacterized protein BDZ99DRAFT_356464, partial [Mytilinidion resinicola]